MSITEPIDSWLSAEHDRWEHAVIRVPMCQAAKPVRSDMRQPRQHRRLHDGPTLYDPETGAASKAGVPNRCQMHEHQHLTH